MGRCSGWSWWTADAPWRDEPGAESLPVVTKDALAGKHGEWDVVLANPPFGRKSSVTVVNEAGGEEKQSLASNRDNFWASTTSKQLNFLQHYLQDPASARAGGGGTAGQRAGQKRWGGTIWGVLLKLARVRWGA